MTRSGTTLVLMPPSISPTVSCGEPMPAMAETRSASALRQRVERRKDRGRRLQRIDAGEGHGGVGRAAAHLDLEMQAAVVRGDDRVGEAGADREIGLA